MRFWVYARFCPVYRRVPPFADKPFQIIFLFIYGFTGLNCACFHFMDDETPVARLFYLVFDFLTHNK